MVLSDCHSGKNSQFHSQEQYVKVPIPLHVHANTG